MIDPNEPAYPCGLEPSENESCPDDMNHKFPGLTIRADFAKAAMQGLCANPAIVTPQDGTPSQVAEWAGQYADALIAELNRQQTPHKTDGGAEC